MGRRVPEQPPFYPAALAAYPPAMADELHIPSIRAFGAEVDFGETAADYGKHRAGFPAQFFERLAEQVALAPGLAALDVGTGAGTIVRALAARGLAVSGLDIAEKLMAEAAQLDAEAGVSVAYHVGTAEDLPFPEERFDIVTAGQCWHWFDREKAATEAVRVLKPGGALVIAHFDWLPLPGSVVEATEALILEANPKWTMAGGVGMYPQWLADMAGAGLTALETRSFDVDQPYTHDAWRGRIRASAGVSGSLPPDAVAAFDARHAAMLKERFPEDALKTPHRVWWAVGRKGA